MIKNYKSKAAGLLRKVVNKHSPVGVMKSAVGLVKDKIAENKSKSNLSNMRDDLAIQKAQIIHKENYGHTMSPSYLKNELDGGIMSKEARDYLRVKREERKKLND